MEYGPEGIFATSSTSGNNGNSSTFGAGGFFDYNLVPNVSGTEMVYGAGGQADFAQTKTGNTSGTGLTFFGGGFLKWFPLGNSVAIRGDAGLHYGKAGAGNTAVTVVGLEIKGGLAVYF